MNPPSSAALSEPASESSSFSTESYFSSQPQPPDLARRVESVRDFIARWTDSNRKVVVITSGGTTVPLESNTVRFLDNFSAGTRGATSAEYFLAAGYAVIFIHRQHSLRPFSRHYSHSLNPFLDLLVVSDPSSSSSPTAPIQVHPSHASRLLPILQAYHAAQREHTLLQVDFVTVNEYLWLLRAVTGEMQHLGRRGMFYLAAAVSDFFLPCHRVAQHKIQSTKGNLTLEMDQVPKVLKPLVQEWIPEAYIVSFKLETDEALLVPKAQTALTRYGHQVVVGNELHRRKHEVVLVENDETGAGEGEHFRETWLKLEDLERAKRGQGSDQEAVQDLELEELIVGELVERHERWIRDAGGGGEAIVVTREL